MSAATCELPDVFISYSHQDKATADAVCAGLEAAAVRCWMAPRDLEPGAEWPEGIVSALRCCRAMVLVYSANANGSRDVWHEVKSADHLELRILPFRIDNSTPRKRLEYLLGGLHWLDASTPPVEVHIARLVKALKGQLDAGPQAADTRLQKRSASRWHRAHPMLAAGWAVLAVAGIAIGIFQLRNGLVTYFAESIRNDINRGSLEHARQTMTQLATIAPSSGHTYFLEAELQRKAGPGRNIQTAMDWFERYMDDPRNKAILKSPRTDSDACYESAAGFCRQRTGWVGLLLANLHYRLGNDNTIPDRQRLDHLRRADAFLTSSLEFYPKGFPATVSPPTRVPDIAWSSRDLSPLIAQALARQ